MSLAQIARFRPAGPWRLGPDSGAPDRVDRLLHSDSLYSAVTLAMSELNRLDDWLEATARAGEPAVRLSSAFPFHGDTLFAPPPMSCWPPAPSPRVRWKGARFVPIQGIARLLRDGGLNDNDWIIDAESECLIPVGKGRSGAPFRVGLRSGAAVDRITGAAGAGHTVGCLEFAPGAGLWMAVSYANDGARARWSPAVSGALRLLGDTGIGGERSRGWGRSEGVELRDAGSVFAPFAAPEREVGAESGWWLLSLFSPADDERVDWTRGAFSTVTRTGRSRSGELKRGSRMIAEGSVLMTGAPLRGIARDVAPAGSQHPIYRWGAAFAVPAYARGNDAASQNRAAQTTSQPVHPTPEPADTIPEPADVTPERAETAPEPTNIVAEPAHTMPEPADTIPEPSDTMSEPPDTIAVPAHTIPEPPEATSEPAHTAPGPTDAAPESAHTTSAQTMPEPPDIIPDAAHTILEPPDTTPEPAETAPEPTHTTPEPQDAVPEPPDTVPEPPQATPEPAQTVPEPPDTTPEPAHTAPEPTHTTPERPDAMLQPQDAIPEPPDTLPEPGHTIPEPPDAVPEPPDTTPEPPDTTPELSDAAREPADTMPEPAKSNPEAKDTPPEAPEKRPE